MKNRKKHNALKKWAGRIHLWLGLITGLIVFIVAVTGCIYVFHDEIKDAVWDWRTIKPKQQSFIEPSQLQQNLKQKYSNASDAFIIYSGKDRPAAIYSVKNTIPYYFYFDPYTGRLLYEQNFKTDFFEIIKALHMYLLLPPAIGKQVVGISSLIFILMMITGIILWWPKKWKNLKNNLKVKWNARTKRLNYDLHNISGFYIHILAIIIAITGLVFSYEWVGDGLYLLGNAGKTYESDKEPTSVPPVEASTSEDPIDIAFYKTIQLKPENEMYFVWDNGKDRPIETGAYPYSLRFDHQSNYFFHPQSAELLKTHAYNDKSSGLQLREMSYGLHTGQYFNLPGKIVAFVVSLFVASLPVTGLIIWLGRKYPMKHLTWWRSRK